MIPQTEIIAEGWQRDVATRNRLVAELSREVLRLRRETAATHARSAGAVPENSPLRREAGWQVIRNA